MRLRAFVLRVAFGAALVGSPADADDIGAAARGVVRVIVAAEDYVDPQNSSVAFGSGFAISPHRIVTNAHVVEAAENPYADSLVAIIPSEGSHALRGTIIAFDSQRDLAIVDVGATRLEPVAIYSGPVEPGEHAAALGYPGNVDRATVRSMYDLITPSAPVRAEGNISSQRSIDGTPALLHTAPISRGNSGGPLVDECGRVLGVNTYTAITESGDSPFGFAVVSQELMSFLREHGEKFQQVGTACVSMAEQAQREAVARDSAARDEALAQQQAAREQQHRLDTAKAVAQDSRENHLATSALLAVLALITGVVGAVLFLKDRPKAAIWSGAVASLGITAAAYAFLSRPSLDVDMPNATISAATDAKPVAGKMICQVQPDRSRITVSPMDDLAINWEANGCMNGRTQYVQDADKWRRVLVPNGSETVFVQDFDPLKREYVSTRYLLTQTEMDRLRQIRAANGAKSCISDLAAIQRLQQVTDELVSSLPPIPNEKLVYTCRAD